MSKKNNPVAKMILFDGKNYFTRMKTIPINGKLIDGLIPMRSAMDQIIQWYKNYAAYKAIRYMYEMQVQNTTDEETLQEYKKQLAAHINTYRPAPEPGKTHMFRWRVVKTTLNEENEEITLLEPAYSKDEKGLQRIGY